MLQLYWHNRLPLQLSLCQKRESRIADRNHNALTLEKGLLLSVAANGLDMDVVMLVGDNSIMCNINNLQ